MLMEFDARRSLAFTYTRRGFDMRILGDVLGWDAQGKRLLDSASARLHRGWT